jgi:hypothetical protein
MEVAIMGKKRTVEADELAAAEALLDKLDRAQIGSPDADATDLRRIGEAADAVERARDALAQAVASARSHGRSWGQIGMVLGVSRQAARERFGTPSPRSATD